jgi:hypothetical protein
MIAITAITPMANVTITITLLPQNINSKHLSKKAKGGTGRFPLLLVLGVVSEAR